MDLTTRFRRALARPLLDAMGVAALALPALLGVGCGGKVVVDAATSGTGGAGGASGDTSSSVTTATGTETSSTGAGCTLTSTGVTAGSGGNVKTQVTSCFPLPAGKCPDQYQAIMFITPSSPCDYVVSVDCGPVVGATCCYLVTEEGGGCKGD